MNRAFEKFGMANTITMVRIVLIPIFLAILLVDWPNFGPLAQWEPTTVWLQPLLSALVFAVIAATDAVDGHIARTRNEVTTFGKFVDPLADKLLVTAALLALVQLSYVPAWVAFVIIAREFIVSGLRLVAVSEGVVIAASNWGKVKTVTQIVAIVLTILSDSSFIKLFPSSFAHGAQAVSEIVLFAAILLTVWSMIDYFLKSSEVLDGPWKR